MGGSTNYSGYLTIQLDNGQWAAVCGNGNNANFGAADATVVCRQLGLPWIGATACSGYCDGVLAQNAGPGSLGTLPYIMPPICAGGEAQVSDCPHYQPGSMARSSCYNGDAGIIHFAYGGDPYAFRLSRTPTINDPA